MASASYSEIAGAAYVLALPLSYMHGEVLESLIQKKVTMRKRVYNPVPHHCVPEPGHNMSPIPFWMQVTLPMYGGGFLSISKQPVVNASVKGYRSGGMLWCVFKSRGQEIQVLSEPRRLKLSQH